MNTEIGKIAEVLSNTKEGKTPLQQKLNGLSKIISFAILGLCTFIFAVTLLRERGAIDSKLVFGRI